MSYCTICIKALHRVRSCFKSDGMCLRLQPKKAKLKASSTPDSSTDKPAKKSKAKPKARTDSPEENGAAKGKAKKPRKKKDKNEPKKGLSAFMFFSQANLEKVSKLFNIVIIGVMHA